VQSGKGELTQPIQRSVLQRQLLQFAEAAEGERPDHSYIVSVEVEFPQLFEAVEGVRSQATNVVLRQRQMLHRDRNVIRDLSQSSSIAQHLRDR